MSPSVIWTLTQILKWSVCQKVVFVIQLLQSLVLYWYIIEARFHERERFLKFKLKFLGDQLGSSQNRLVWFFFTTVCDWIDVLIIKMPRVFFRCLQQDVINIHRYQSRGKIVDQFICLTTHWRPWESCSTVSSWLVIWSNSHGHYGESEVGQMISFRNRHKSSMIATDLYDQES